MKKWCLSLILVSFTCLGSVSVKSDQYGKDWPFTVKSGTISCLSNSSIIFQSGTKTYALNGVASQYGYLPLEPIWKLEPDFLAYQKDLAIKEKTSLEEIQEEQGKLRINISKFIQLGLQQCPGQAK